VKWCDAHSYAYDVAERYEIHGKSAYHGKHAEALDRAFDDMAEGKYTVLVVWAADRIERRGALAALTLAERAREAGGRIEYVKDAHLNTANEMSDVMLALSGSMARQESKRKAERIVAKHDALRAAGSVVGRPPWGYKITDVQELNNDDLPVRTVTGRSTSGRKVLVPTAEGRKYVPQVFQRVIDGQSCREIAAWLDAQGITTMTGKRWNEGYIATRLIKNKTYMGQRPNSGTLETPALVSPTVWQEANAVLAGRAKPGRGTVKREKALLSPVCGECDRGSPMYRIKTWQGFAYRCTGRGPQRKGCGCMVPLSVLDELVTDEVLSARRRMHTERVFIPGDDRSDEIAREREKAAEAARKGDYAAMAEAAQRAAEMEAQPRTAAHWDERVTGLSEADHFASLTPAERRGYLARSQVKVWRRDCLITAEITTDTGLSILGSKRLG
jgi:DNA invertase Pin-like site-specific DNA recombinase